MKFEGKKISKDFFSKFHFIINNLFLRNLVSFLFFLLKMLKLNKIIIKNAKLDDTCHLTEGRLTDFNRMLI